MKIKIDPANTEKIESALAAVNGRAASFCLTTAKEILDVAKRAEESLSLLKKANRTGVRCLFSPSGPASRNYKYKAISTKISLVRGASCWFLDHVSSLGKYPGEGEYFELRINKDQAAEITKLPSKFQVF